MEVLRTLGVPYSDQEIGDKRRLQVRGKTKGEALIRYLQSLVKIRHRRYHNEHILESMGGTINLNILCSDGVCCR